MGSSNTADGEAGAASFAEGEKVLAFHGPLIYEAKVQKAERRKDELRYYVHYLGWSKNWDEWVGGDRLLKHTEENVRKQQELEKATDKNAKSGRSAQNKLKGTGDSKGDKEEQQGPAKGKKRKVQHSGEEKSKRLAENFLMANFPLTLKKQLVDDSEFVTQLGKLVKLPRSPNVDEIFRKYLEYRTKKDGMISESVAEILKGLRCYFDKALPAMLLYKRERQQYSEVITGDISPSTIYGAEHLLRLFVKLPELLAYVNMEEEALTKLHQKLLDFLKFLQKNQSSFFLSSYDGSKNSDSAKAK